MKGKKKRSKVITAVLFCLLILIAGSLIFSSNITGKSIKTFFDDLFNFPQSPAKPPTVYQCNDHIDNDKDGYCDYKGRGAYCSDGSILGDSKCSSSKDKSEYPENTNNTSNSTSPSAGCKPLRYDNGALRNKVILVFVPSNFNGDMTLFEEKAKIVFSEFYQHAPFDANVNQFYSFFVTKESGNYCYLNCGGTDRLLCCDTAKAKQLSSVCTTGPRQTIVIQNDPAYGGAGYITEDVATTTTHYLSPQVAVHEIGHSLFNLGDEYSYQYASSPSNSANCDYSACKKWNNMINFNGVSCVSSSCGNGAYYTSETTVMKALGYKFEEVNMRATCCIYYAITNSLPYYCSQFNNYVPNEDLAAFCKTFTSSSSTGATPMYEYIEQPYQYEFSLDENGEWKLDNRTQLSAGQYSTKKTKGEAKGSILVEAVSSKKNIKKSLYFEPEIDVEYTSDLGKLGGYIKQHRKSMSIIIDDKDNFDSISINKKEVYKK